MNDPGRDLVHPGPSQVARTRGRTTVSMSAATRTTRALHSQSGNATSARCRPARPHRWTLRITSTPDRTPRPSATPNPHRGRELRRTSGTQDWTTHPRDPRTGHVMTRTTGQSVTFSQYPPTPQLRPMGRHLLGPGMDAAPTTGTFPGSDRRTRLDTPPNQGPDPGRQTEPHSKATEPTNNTFPVSGLGLGQYCTNYVQTATKPGLPAPSYPVTAHFKLQPVTPAVKMYNLQETAAAATNHDR